MAVLDVDCVEVGLLEEAPDELPAASDCVEDDLEQISINASVDTGRLTCLRLSNPRPSRV